jgi:nucleotide-binding universal stress UspA family protein
MFDKYPPNSVVVGVDGSRAAIRAARWAVGEVAGTDIPIRLLYVTKANPGVSPSEARAAMESAEEVVHEAYTAIDAMGESLKVEMELIDGLPVPGLVTASRGTRMICIGDTGSAQHPGAWLGSTAREVAKSGHCSVAIIRSDRHSSGAGDDRWIVARVDESPDGIDVLELALNEALRRDAPLRVLTAAQSRPGEKDHPSAMGHSDFTRCMHDYPEVEVRTVRLDGSFVDYLAAHAASIQLAMVGAAQTGEVEQLLGDAGAKALRDSDFNLAVVGLQRPGR